MNENNIGFAEVLASICAIIVIPICLNKCIGNLGIYILSLLLFVTIYSVTLLFLWKKKNLCEKKFSGVVIMILFLSALLVLGISYMLNAIPFYEYYAWGILPDWLVISVIFLFFLSNIYWIFKYRGTNQANILNPLYIMASFAYAVSRYNPNIINANIYDATAYLTSIFNVYHGTPYNIDTTGIYGHYAIFFKLPMLLFGNDIVSVSVMVAIVAGITFLAFSYAINNLIKNNLIKVLVVFSALLEPLYALPYSYYQSSPNRYLFPALLMALMAYDIKKEGKVNVWIGAAIASLGLIWNLESGIAVAVAWFIYLSIRDLQKEVHIVNKKIIRNVLMIPLELILSISLFVLYNILSGGTPSISIFFYPYNHHLKEFALPIQWGNYAYIYIIPIFMGMFMWAVVQIKIFGRKNNYAAPIGAIATIGVALFSYYMNRFASCNVWMIVWEFALLLGILSDKSIIHIKEIVAERKCTAYVGTKSALAIFSLAVLSALSLGNIFSGGMQLSLFQSGTKDVESMYKWAEEIEAIVPPDTYAAGEGTIALYSCLEWDYGFHINDLPNIIARPEAVEAFYESLYDKERLFVASDVMDMDTLLTNGNYRISNTFLFGPRTYYYLEKN